MINHLLLNKETTVHSFEYDPKTKQFYMLIKTPVPEEFVRTISKCLKDYVDKEEDAINTEAVNQ